MRWGRGQPAVRSEALPRTQSAITHSSGEAGSHHAAEKQRSSPSQLNLIGVSGVNNATGRGVLQVFRKKATREEKIKSCKRESAERNHVECVFSPRGETEGKIIQNK